MFTEYAALRPRENSASGTTVTVSQKSFTDSLTTLQTRESSIPARKSSQDSGITFLEIASTRRCWIEMNCTGGMITSDDEDTKKETNASTNQQRAVEADIQLEPSWRVFKPRMSLAVLTVSLQHIVAHSKSHTASKSITHDESDVSTQVDSRRAPPYAARSLSLDERIQPNR